MGWPRRLLNLARRDRVARDIHREMSFHLAERVDELVASGMTESDARHAARRQFGNYESQRDRTRDMDMAVLIESTAKDVRYALRGLRKNPGFTLAAVAVLALGIGANTAVFSVVNGILLRPLPYPNPGRLVMIFDSFQQQGKEHGPACVADFLDWRSRSRSFQTLDAVAPNRFTVTGDGEAEQIVGLVVTATFFEALGARPLAGRTFAADEDQPGRTATFILSERLWRRRYASNPGMVGKVIALNGRPYTVIGIMPAAFQSPFGPRDLELWSILTLDPPRRRGPFFLQGLARLKSGVTIERASAEMNAIAQDVNRANPRDYDRLRYPVAALRETMVGGIRPLLWILSGAVLLVLLIAVSNVCSLMLARATARRHEIAIRLSIGAGRAHVLRQLMTESLVLAMSGAVVGVALASWGVATLQRLDRNLPRLNAVSLDGRVLAFTLLVSIASAVVFGLAPAFAASRAALGDSLKQGGRGSDSQSHGRARGALVIAQVAFSVLLLIGAGLLIRSFDQLGRVQLGFQAPPDRVLTMLISPTGSRYRDSRALGAYWDQLVEHARAIPGVESASVSLDVPPDRLAFTDGFEIQGKPTPPGIENPSVPVPFVSHDYFRTLGIPLLRGRWFDRRDTADSPGVVIISDTLARRYFPNEEPIGKRLKHGGRALNNPYLEIIGVVGDVKYQGLDSETGPVYYELSAQASFRPMWLLLRTNGPATAVASAARQAIRDLDSDVPVARVSTLADAVYDSVSLPRFRSLLMGIFAAASVLLAALGIYGVISYSVTQRTRELGVRMALGATSTSVLRLVVGQGSRLALFGIALGLAGAVALTRVLKNMLFGVSPTDLPTFAGVAAVLGAIAIIASLIPACRAAQVDPVTALRND
jgi:putative ABC transport system permease protein